MATSEMSPDYSETEAFKVFAAMCWEQHKERHPAANIDPTRFAEISTGRWKAMTQEQKNAFFYKFQEDEAQKAKLKRKESKAHDHEPKSKKPSVSTEDENESAKIDVKKPKGKKSAFSFFSSEKSAVIKKEYPTLNKNAVAEEVDKMWKGLNNEEKNKYNEMASKDEARFNEQTKAFQATTSNTVYKAAKDPNKPKQAKNPFMFFNAEFSLKIRAENPDSHMTVGEVAKAVSVKWQSLTDQEKQKYIDLADKDKQRHEEEMKNYQAPPPVMVAVKDKNAPKAAKNAYSLFGADISAQIKSENGNLSLSDKSKEIGKRWKEADADTRRKYAEQAAADKLRYENEMKDYKPSNQTKKKKKDQKNCLV